MTALDTYHPSSVSVISAALRALDLVDYNDEATASSLFILDRISSAFGRFPMVLCVNVAAALGLKSMTSNSPRIRSIVSHPTVLHAVFASMRRHISSELLLDTCCSLIWNLAANNAAMKVPLVELGAIGPVCDALDASIRGSSLYTNACGALYSFSADSRNKPALLASRAVTLLRRAYSGGGTALYWVERALKNLGVPP